jgi:hypothetical protein
VIADGTEVELTLDPTIGIGQSVHHTGAWTARWIVLWILPVECAGENLVSGEASGE